MQSRLEEKLLLHREERKDMERDVDCLSAEPMSDCVLVELWLHEILADMYAPFSIESLILESSIV